MDDQTTLAGRPSWDTYFIGLAREAASRATCPRKHVGAVAAIDNEHLLSGYNGSIKKLAHCHEVGCLMEGGHCIRTNHAEANIVALAARRGIAIGGSTLYVTASPCWGCFKLLANAGVRRIVYSEFYRDPRIFEAARELGIDILHLPTATRPR